jgi:hypothetical protein
MKKNQLFFENNIYQLECGNYLKAKIRLLWFPLRRMLRRTRRCIAYLRYWIVLFIPFLIVSALLLFVFAEFGLIEVEDIPSFILSLILGTCLLLVIKDIWDRELKRHDALKKQFEMYSSSRYSADSYLQRIAGDCGIVLEGDARFPLMNETCSNRYYDQLSSSEAANINLDELQNDLLGLKKVMMNLQGKISVLPLIDNNDYSLDMNFDSTNIAIENLRNAAMKGNEFSVRRHMQQIVLRAFHIFACLRRPWRYPMDLNKKQELQAWLNAHSYHNDSYYGK